MTGSVYNRDTRLEDLDLTERQQECLAHLRAMGFEVETLGDLEDHVTRVVEAFRPIFERLGVLVRQAVTQLVTVIEANPDLQAEIQRIQREQAMTAEQQLDQIAGAAERAYGGPGYQPPHEPPRRGFEH